MSKKNSIINTPELLRAFNLGVPYKDIDSYPEVQAPNDSFTEEEKQQQYESRPKALGGDTEIKTANSSNYVKDDSSTVVEETEYSSNEPWAVSKPTGYKLGKNQVGGSRKTKMKRVYNIVLHHTATYLSVKSVQLDIFKPSSWKSSHTAIGEDGHIEYLVNLPYLANAQGKNYLSKGKQKTPKCSNFNLVSISTELCNYGYLSNSFKGLDGKTYWYRGKRDGKKPTSRSVFEESQTSVPYDYNMNPQRRYKSFKRCPEYTDAQLNSMVKWIKAMQKYIADTYPSSKSILDWKYTQKTHNQMFPDFKSKNLPKNFIEKGGYYTDGPNNEYLITGMYSEGKNANKSGWAVSADINNNVPGIYTHNSISTGKSDVFPTKKMVQCLKANFG